MSQMIQFGGVMIRICPQDAHKLEFSHNGFLWIRRGAVQPFEFLDLTEEGGIIYAQTSKGFYRSRDKGYIWLRRSY